MGNIIEMEDLMHLKLFESVTKISTRFTFMYNNILFFVVPKSSLSKAIGKDAVNVKKMSSIAKKRINHIQLAHEIRRIIQYCRKISWIELINQ